MADDRRLFYKAGVSAERFEKHEDGFEKKHQLKVLKEDIDEVAWELAHFAVYLRAYEKAELPRDVQWKNMMTQACKIYINGKPGTFKDHLDLMEKWLDS